MHESTWFRAVAHPGRDFAHGLVEVANVFGDFASFDLVGGVPKVDVAKPSSFGVNEVGGVAKSRGDFVNAICKVAG